MNDLNNKIEFISTVKQWFRYRLDQLLVNGQERHVLRHPGTVFIVAIPEPGKIIITEQYRYAIDSVEVEIPGGGIEDNEPPINAAARELTEETGYVAKDLVLIGKFSATPGYSDEIMYLYLATGLTQVGQKLDEQEIEDHLIYYTADIEDIYKKISSGEVLTMGTISYGIQYAYLNKL